jgi:hypothetical protein
MSRPHVVRPAAVDANDIARAHEPEGLRKAWDAAPTSKVRGARAQAPEYDWMPHAPAKANGKGDWQSNVVTAAALRTKGFPPVSYIVPGFVPEGLSILAGRPKVGKSWLALDVGLGVADKRVVLGGTMPSVGDVLYLALEDTQRRLQWRITKLLSPFCGEWPDRLTLATQWRRLDDGGVDDIAEWCDSVIKPRLVIIDTLARVRSARSSSDTLYDGDYWPSWLFTT